MRVVAWLVVLGLLAACGDGERAWPLEAPLPEHLSELGLLEHRGDRLEPVSGFVYTLGHTLFSDHASKFRSVHLPAGERAVRPAHALATETLAFPVGTIITKTFYYPVRNGDVVLAHAPEPAHPNEGLGLAGMRLLETRILRHQPAGWEAVSYLWDDAQQEARRTAVGALLELEAASGERFDYLVPDRNQCAACHGGDRQHREVMPIGPKPANLAAYTFADGSNQYALWKQEWVQDAAPVASWPRTPDVRAYLDVNCAHCHRGTGAASSTGLDLRYDAERPFDLGVCKPPVAAGRGAGGLAVGIWPGRPEASILLYRLTHQDPAVMMPELGRSLVDEAAVERVAAWIEAMDGDCTHAGLL